MTAGADLRLLRAAVFTVACVALSMAGHTFVAGATVPLWTVGLACALVFVVAVPLAGRERSLPGIAALLLLGQLALHTLFAYGMRGTAAHAGATAAGVHSGAGHGVIGGGSGGSGGGLKALAAELLCNDGAARPLTEGRARQVIADAGLSAPATAYGPGAADGGHAAHDGALLTLGGLRGVMITALAQLTPAMVLVHLFAALCAGWLLRRGEAALWRLVRLSATAAIAAEELVTVRDLRAVLCYVRALRAGLLPEAPTSPGAFGVRVEDAPRAVLLHHTVSRRGPPPAEGSLALAA